MNLTNNSSRLLNCKHPGSKRLMLEAQEMLNNSDSHYYSAQPMEDNLFEWHFTFRGPQDTDFEGGIYHGRLTFPNEYPMKPPSVYLLTPNGRFETDTKICLSISQYHPETWQPSWGIRTALVALMSFMPTETNRAIGSLDFSAKERRELARKSQTWTCKICGPIHKLLTNPKDHSLRLNQENQASIDNTHRDNSLMESNIASQQSRHNSDDAVINELSNHQHKTVLKTHNKSDKLTYLNTDTSTTCNNNDGLEDTNSTLNRQSPPQVSHPRVHHINQIEQYPQSNNQVETSNIDNTISERPRPGTDVEELAQSRRNFILKSTVVLLLILLLRRLFMIALVA